MNYLARLLTLALAVFALPAAAAPKEIPCSEVNSLATDALIEKYDLPEQTAREIIEARISECRYPSPNRIPNVSHQNFRNISFDGCLADSETVGTAVPAFPAQNPPQQPGSEQAKKQHSGGLFGVTVGGGSFHKSGIMHISFYKSVPLTREGKGFSLEFQPGGRFTSYGEPDRVGTRIDPLTNQDTSVIISRQRPYLFSFPLARVASYHLPAIKGVQIYGAAGASVGIGDSRTRYEYRRIGESQKMIPDDYSGEGGYFRGVYPESVVGVRIPRPRVDGAFDFEWTRSYLPHGPSDTYTWGFHWRPAPKAQPEPKNP